jgi:hypothetical protein
MSTKNAADGVVDPENPEWTKAAFARAVPFSGLPLRLQRALSNRNHKPQRDSQTGKQGVHSRLITQAAKNVLLPIGLVQKGRSRIWVGDHSWWLDVVEFQPSSWSRGSYLNVSCMWLWSVKSYISFDTGSVRIEEFHKYENEEQFAYATDMLAKKAASEVRRYRALFQNVQAVSDYYTKNSTAGDFWRTFNAAVSHGLSGHGELGLKLLHEVIGKGDPSVAWQKEFDADAKYIASIITDVDRLRLEISERVAKTRKLLKLAPSVIDFER